MNGMSSYRRRLMAGAYPKELPNYLCFTALEDGTFSFRYGNTARPAGGLYIEYSIDGKTWVRTESINFQEQIITTPTIRAGEKVYWRGYNDALGTGGGDSNFLSTCSFDVSGDCGSILRKNDFSYVITSGNGIRKLFINCKVVNAADLILPKFTNVGCFAQMFSGCSSLVSAPNFHNDKLSGSCYVGMFKNCTSLITVPFVLDYTTLQGGCYNEMFSGCTSLTTSPLKGGSYSVPSQAFKDMFNNCTNLVNVEDLYITEIKQSGLQHLANMFSNCTQLVHSPIKSFPKQIWQYCYMGLFDGCTNLIDCPELPAETLANLCYANMLKKTKITWIKMLATDISANSCLANWVANVPNVNTSVFVKHIDAQWTTTGNSGVPTNWKVIYYDPALDKYFLDQQRSQECDDHGNPI